MENKFKSLARYFQITDLRGRTRALLGGGSMPFPFTVRFHVSEGCDRRCGFCYGKFWERPAKFMELALFRRLIDELSRSGTKTIVLSASGEPLYHPDIEEMIEYSRSKGLIISLMTNFQRDDLAGFILERINLIYINAASFLGSIAGSRLYPGGINANNNIVLSLVLCKETISLLRRVVEYGQTNDCYMELRLPIVAREDGSQSVFSTEEIRSLMEEAAELYASSLKKGFFNLAIEIRKVLNARISDVCADGEIRKRISYEHDRKYCFAPCFSCFIDAQGYVYGTLPMLKTPAMGDSNKEDIAAIWNKEAFNMMRREFLYNLGSEPGRLAVCNSCPFSGFENPYVSSIVKV